MRVNLLRWFGALLFLAALPMQVRAESSDGFRLDEQGGVSVVSGHAAREKVSSMAFSLSVAAEGAEEVAFHFNQIDAKILEFRYDKEQKELKVYVSGTNALFKSEQEPLALGQISVLDGNGNTVAADVSVVEGSLKYVYGSEQRVMEDVDMPGTVRLGGGTPAATPAPTPQQTPSPTPQPTPVPTAPATPAPQQPVPTATPTPQQPVPTAPATPTPQQPGPAVTATPAPQQPVPGASQASGGNRTPAPSRQPGPEDFGTTSSSPRPEESREPESSAASSPKEDEEDIIFSRPQDEDQKKDGKEPSQTVDLVFVTAIAAIVLFAGVLVMAAVILGKKPRVPRDQDSIW